MSTPSTRFSSPRGRGKADLSREITSERIAAHLADFRRKGGRIEKLGTTRVLSKVDETATQAPLPAAVPSRLHG